jgi:hypothetical protein
MAKPTRAELDGIRARAVKAGLKPNQAGVMATWNRNQRRKTMPKPPAHGKQAATKPTPTVLHGKQALVPKVSSAATVAKLQSKQKAIDISRKATKLAPKFSAPLIGLQNPHLPAAKTPASPPKMTILPVGNPKRIDALKARAFSQDSSKLKAKR